MRDDRDPQQQHARRPALLCLSQSFAPDTTPTAIRSSKLVAGLSRDWDVTVLSESAGAELRAPARVEVVRSRRPQRLIAALRRLRLHKLLELLIWPDDSIFWVLPAVLAGRRVIRETRPSAIVVFMMPYSSGLAGVALSRLSGLPLILNLDDSPTCTDMHPEFPSRAHFHLARALEDFYARRADAVVYVSQTNLDAVRSRQREDVRSKFHLVRYGAETLAPTAPARTASAAAATATPGERFEIAYVGAMSGWWALIDDHEAQSPLSRLYGAWTQLGRYERLRLDHRTSSPAVIGAAILQATAEHPEWAGRVHLSLHGNPYPPEVVQRALAGAGIESVVSAYAPVPHEQVAGILRDADLLFLTLPARPDGSRGGRISAKTYEYLNTDRPILAAVPRGENWDYLADKPGVWLLEPADAEGMRRVITELAQAKFAGAELAFDRANLREQLSYDVRAGEFANVIREAIDRRRSRLSQS